MYSPMSTPFANVELEMCRKSAEIWTVYARTLCKMCNEICTICISPYFAYFAFICDPPFWLWDVTAVAAPCTQAAKTAEK